MSLNPSSFLKAGHHILTGISSEELANYKSSQIFSYLFSSQKISRQKSLHVSVQFYQQIFIFFLTGYMETGHDIWTSMSELVKRLLARKLARYLAMYFFYQLSVMLDILYVCVIVKLSFQTRFNRLPGDWTIYSMQHEATFFNF